MAPATDEKRTALTTLSENEKLFQESVRRFAKERIAPLVKKMDEEAVFDHELLSEFFRLGWMGIEIPESYGGAGENLFHSILAIEEIAAVDPSAATVVDVHNTLVNNALIRWGSDDQKAGSRSQLFWVNRLPSFNAGRRRGCRSGGRVDS